jgi:hypothetical protein
MIRSAAVVYVLEVSPEEVGDLLHDLVVVVCVGQQVEAHRGLLAVHELDMVAVLLEALGVRQLPAPLELFPGTPSPLGAIQ